jgi:hypothetical protein
MLRTFMPGLGEIEMLNPKSQLDNSFFVHTSNLIPMNQRSPGVRRAVTRQQQNSKKCCRRPTKMRTPTFTKLLQCSEQDRRLSAKQREFTIEFLENHLTYCDEIFEYVTKDGKPLAADLTDNGMCYFETLEIAAEALLKRIKSAKRNDKRYLQKVVMAE